ncbi:MAG TPA: DUF58 domain-containing protein [Bacteroidia bacterium]
MRSFFKTIYIAPLLYYMIAAEVVFLVMGFFFPLLYGLSIYTLLLILVLIITDAVILYANKIGISAKRNTLEKLSNGDENPVTIHIENKYSFPARLTVIDELPYQLQKRDAKYVLQIQPADNKTIQYIIRPVKRGEYHFGALNIFVKNQIGFLERRYRFSNHMIVPVYPSFIQMRKYELLAINNRISDSGIKKIRRIGNHSEFDQIKEYVGGDDYRTINWKATARKERLMVNQYQDERSQQVYSLIDMGRVMQMPFEGLSLLDYSINSSLVISNIAMLKNDKAGVITFSSKVQSVLPAERKSGHLSKILQLLYSQKTDYLESDFENLYINVKNRINTRSLLLLFSNFESLPALKRQIKYLKRLSKDHLLVVVFFENTELKKFIHAPAISTENIYHKTIAEKFAMEKKLILKELDRYGIHSILTDPKNLSVNTINKYLELKARGLL